MQTEAQIKDQTGNSDNRVLPLVVGGLTITCEDNMVLMSRYPDNYFDLAIVDPPYGCSANWKNTGKGLIAKNKLSKWDVPPEKKYFDELFRVSKNQIIWGGNFFTNYLPISDNWVCFQKYGIPSLPEFELAWTNTDVKNKVWGASRLDLNINYGKLIHPTQKPIQLYKWILKNYAQEGFKIIDTHLGSGSHAIAVEEMNRFEKMNLTLTACEIDKDYFIETKQRIINHVAQQSLF